MKKEFMKNKTKKSVYFKMTFIFFLHIEQLSIYITFLSTSKMLLV